MKTRFNEILLFHKTTFYLDYRLLKINELKLPHKFEFIIKKYLIIATHFFKKFKLGENYTNLFGDKIFYDSRYGLATYQGILTRHLNLIKMAGIKNPKVVIDIGANVGFFSLLIKKIFPKSELYSIEPIPEIHKLLKKNLGNYKKIKTYNFAISNKKGILKMVFDRNNPGTSAIADQGKITVKTITLDEFITKYNISQIDLLKIDTEGHEKEVLESGKKALSKTKYLFIEITIEDNNSYTLPEVMCMLKGNGYNFQLVNFRNFGDTSEGKMPIMDALFKNLSILK